MGKVLVQWTIHTFRRTIAGATEGKKSPGRWSAKEAAGIGRHIGNERVMECRHGK